MGHIIYQYNNEIHQDELPFDFEISWGEFLVDLVNRYDETLKILEIENATFMSTAAYVIWENTKFINCTISAKAFDLCSFQNVGFYDCKCGNTTMRAFCEKGAKFFVNGKLVRTQMTNEEIEQKVHGKVFSLPNDKFVKVRCTCDFCHKDYEQILNRATAEPFMRKVPNCDRLVCDSCYSLYRLNEKEVGNRTYGYRGGLSFYRTPMDKINTAILGLEMEFEGDFYGWKELEDAHKGTLHFGYDSSVKGQNELSWDCGSYSWWKYLSPLKQVCDALKNNGGSEGPTAGIHIHVSRRDVASDGIAMRLYESVKESRILRIALIAVSMRTNLEKMETYANLDSSPSHHHSAISYSRHNTVEFRIFQSSLDPGVILKRLLLCKTLFNLAASGVKGAGLLSNLPKVLKNHIIDCATIQKERKIISTNDFNKLKEFLEKKDK